MANLLNVRAHYDSTGGIFQLKEKLLPLLNVFFFFFWKSLPGDTMGRESFYQVMGYKSRCGCTCLYVFFRTWITASFGATPLSCSVLRLSTFPLLSSPLSVSVPASQLFFLLSLFWVVPFPNSAASLLLQKHVCGASRPPPRSCFPSQIFSCLSDGKGRHKIPFWLNVFRLYGRKRPTFLKRQEVKLDGPNKPQPKPSPLWGGTTEILWDVRPASSANYDWKIIRTGKGDRGAKKGNNTAMELKWNSGVKPSDVIHRGEKRIFQPVSKEAGGVLTL